MRATQLILLVTVAIVTAPSRGWAVFTEAPELHAQVVAGKLPPLEQRLPIAPLIVTPVEKPGTYGGTWRMAIVAGEDNSPLLSRCLAYEQLVRWNPNWTRVVPNLAISWTINADATVYRFQLRQGVRWSDGQPFTAHDIVAWIDDVVRDPELTPSPPGWLLAGGRLPECTAPDDTTVEFRFAVPNAIFLELLASMNANELTRYPAHHLRKVHRRHNPAGAAELMRQTGRSWIDSFRTVFTPWTWRNPSCPTLDAWIITNAYTPEATAVVAARNPYYWKVDTLGRQLPYLDRVRFEVVTDRAELFRRELAGEVDYNRANYFSYASTPAILEAEKEGRIRTVRAVSSNSNPIAIFLNLNHADPVMRAALGDKRVRIALSKAINRPAIIQQLYSAEAMPWQIAPRPESPFRNRRLGEQFTTYAPEQSKAELEAAGLHARESDGMRLLRDGRLFKLTILVPRPSDPDWPAIMDRVKSDWRAIGVEMEWTFLMRGEFNEQITQNRHDGAIANGSGGFAPILEPECFVPATFEYETRMPYGARWARWFSNPQAPGAEKPPAMVEKQMALYRQVMAEPNRESRAALMTQVLEIAADEFYAIGLCLDPVRVEVRTPGFRNFPASHFDSWLYPDPGPFNPCQFSLESLSVAK